MSHFDITCPEDYQKYFNVNEQGYVWFDGRNNPIPLSQELTKRMISIPSHTLWSGRHTRSGVHSKDTPPHKGGPHNCTGKTQALPSLDTPTIPISPDQEVHGGIVQGVLDNPMILRSLVGAAWERARNHFSPKNMIIYSLGTRCHNLPQIFPIPTTRVQHQIQTKIQTLNKLTLTWLWNHVKSLENKIKQDSEQLQINMVKHKSDLRYMSQ